MGAVTREPEVCTRVGNTGPGTLLSRIGGLTKSIGEEPGTGNPENRTAFDVEGG